jgi:tellurite resistance protein
MILTTPLALAFTVYHQLEGKYDIVSGALFYFNIFLLLILGSKVVLVTISCPFKVTWWAISFPLSAVTIPALIYCQHRSDTFHQLFAASLLVLVTFLVIYLLIMTIFKIITKTYA